MEYFTKQQTGIDCGNLLQSMFASFLNDALTERVRQCSTGFECFDQLTEGIPVIGSCVEALRDAPATLFQ